MDPRLRDTSDVAEYLRVSRRFVRLLVERGDLPVVRVGRLLRFDIRDLDALVDRWRAESTNAPNAGLSAAALKGWRSTPVRPRRRSEREETHESDDYRTDSNA